MMKLASVFLAVILVVAVFCSSEEHEKQKMEGNTGDLEKIHHRMFRRQVLAPYGSYGNVQYGGSGPSAGSGWNGGLVGSARGFGFGTGSDGYH